MSKLKTKSGVKKRFRATASGKIKRAPACKGHGMTKRPQRMIQQARGMSIMKDMDVARLQPSMPYGL